MTKLFKRTKEKKITVEDVLNSPSLTKEEFKAQLEELVFDKAFKTGAQDIIIAMQSVIDELKQS